MRVAEHARSLEASDTKSLYVRCPILSTLARASSQCTFPWSSLPDLVRPGPAMGSLPPFHPEQCVHCRRFVVDPCYPRLWLCSECDVICRSPILVRLLRQRLRREPDAGMVATIAGFCAPDTSRRRRLYFLWAILISPRSCFQKFTFFHGGRSGNVSDQEDILDRIMSFV